MISFVCITLISCKTEDLVYITAPSNSAVDLFFQGELGNVVQITEPANFPDVYYTVGDICSSFDASPGSNCEICFENAINIDLEYVTSTGSQECPVTTAYVLFNCKAENLVIGDLETLVQSSSGLLVTSTDLALYVGGVINIAEYPGECYGVTGPYTENTGCPCPYYTVTNAYKDCECCLPNEPEVFVRTTQQPVKQFYHITDSQCEIRTNTKFADNYYRLFQGLKYGIQNCCGDVNFDKLWIEKELSDYIRINPPGQCVPLPTPEEPVECPVTPVLLCGIPEDVSGTGTLD